VDGFVRGSEVATSDEGVNVCGKVRRAVGGWWTGDGAFAVSGRAWEDEFALPPRGRVRVDSGRRLVGVGGFGPNLSVSSLKSHRRCDVATSVRGHERMPKPGEARPL
jgi:hypothetical protein